VLLIILGIVILSIGCILRYGRVYESKALENAYYEPIISSIDSDGQLDLLVVNSILSEDSSYVAIIDTVINDVPLNIYILRNLEFSLHVGPINKNDTTIVYAAQAADIRADNGGIVGAFVLKGEPLARGLSKKGYCAIIDGKVSVGVAESSPLFERATEREGYFFRQFAFVDNGVLVENKSRGKYVRRAICSYFGSIIIIESLTKESYHDFAQVLVDFGVSNAVSLVGGTAYGWAIDGDGIRHEFGEEKIFSVSDKMKRNINYLVCRKK
jgi:hypothetical protein